VWFVCVLACGVQLKARAATGKPACGAAWFDQRQGGGQRGGGSVGMRASRAPPARPDGSDSVRMVACAEQSKERSVRARVKIIGGGGHVCPLQR